MRCHACDGRMDEHTDEQWKVVQYSFWAESAILSFESRTVGRVVFARKLQRILLCFRTFSDKTISGGAFPSCGRALTQSLLRNHRTRHCKRLLLSEWSTEPCLFARKSCSCSNVQTSSYPLKTDRNKSEQNGRCPSLTFLRIQEITIPSLLLGYTTRPNWSREVREMKWPVWHAFKQDQG